jgi:two-component system CheB/CheR fusion protein
MNPSEIEDCNFHVVGIGASAGGLEAIEKLFESLPPNTGASFVVVQHLSPDFKSHMEQLLARKTKMPIYRVENEMPVEPNTVYLIPPNTEMVIANRRLLLTERDPEETLNLPIDHFLRSLANDCGSTAVGVILSGTGSDGSRGIVSINEAGGLVLCQDEDSAKFDGMPLSAQETGAVHLVLSPEQIAGALGKYIKQTLSPDLLAEQELVPKGDSPLDEIFALLRRNHTIDFSLYKPTTVRRRIERRMGLIRMPTVEEYVELLRDDTEELNSLYKDLLIGVTQFFRDKQAFEELRTRYIPRILEKKRDQDEAVRVWISGCATGEEAYSIAILFDEVLREKKLSTEVKIFATDAHRSSLAFASVGVYPEDSLKEISAQRKETYFSKTENGFLISPEIRKMIVFAPHDVINDAPFTRLDLVTCRNLLIYLQPTVQKKVISLFHFALRTNSFMFLGPSETPGDLIDEFDVENKKWRIYRKRRDVRLTANVKLPLGGSALVRPFAKPKSEARPTPETQMLSTYDRLLDSHMPPSFLVDESGELIHSFGGSERFLTFRGGRISTNLMDIIHEDLKTPVSGAIQHATREMKAVRYTGITVKTGKGLENVRLVVDPMRDPRTEVVHTLIALEPIEAPPEFTVGNDEEVDVRKLSRDHIHSLENELRYTKENLQATVEELETSNEELHATNEELIASNEEMQSTNEELQSVNEELYTVNAEHQRKIAELTEARDDMSNLYRTTDVGVIFLDSDLRIRRFTPKIAETFNMMPQDIGRSIENFVHGLTSIDLVAGMREVIESGEPSERELEDRRGNFWLLKKTPYRTQTQSAGIVLTLVDINSVKQSAAELDGYREIVEASLAAIVRTEPDGTITHWNEGAQRLYGYTAEEAVGERIQILTPPELVEDTVELFRRFHDGEKIRDYQTVRLAKDKTRRFIVLNVAPVRDRAGEIIGCSSVSHDYTQNFELAARSRVFERAFESSLTAMVITDPNQKDNPIVYANPGFEKLTGYQPKEVIGRNCRFLQGKESDPATVRKINRAIKRGESCHVKIINYRKSGQKFWNELVITPVHNDEGDVTHFVGVQFDMTTHQRAESRLTRELDIAEAANAAKSNFVANMSHEIRTPLTTIVGMTELLLDQEVEKTKHDTLQLIHQSGRHLVNLVNDILDISKIEAGKLESQIATVSPMRVLADVAGTMSYKAKEKGLDFTLDYKGLIPETVQSDPIRLRQILFNLTGNAVKFTESGGIKVTTELVNRNKNPRLKITVEDTGIGFENDKVEKLFGQFNQLDETPTRAKGGTGLGLYISRRLVQHLGGKLTAKGKVGVGSSFTFTIPTGDLSTAVFVDPKAKLESSSPQQATKPQTGIDANILVVEDTPGIQMLVRRILEKIGARVSVAASGTKALELFGISESSEAKVSPDAFDLIVLDMHMPGISGYDTAKALRDAGFKMPIVALTASAMQGDKEKCLAAGCDAYLTKPIDRQKLISNVRELLV